MDIAEKLKALKEAVYGRYHELPADVRDEWLQALDESISVLAPMPVQPGGMPPQEPTDGQGTG